MGRMEKERENLCQEVHRLEKDNHSLWREEAEVQHLRRGPHLKCCAQVSKFCSTLVKLLYTLMANLKISRATVQG